jgi:integrase
LNWAVDKAELEASPAAGLRRPAPVRARDRVLSDDELRRLWMACDQRPFPFGRYVQILLLTACRRSELATLRWSDVDLAEKAIVIPGDRYKTGRPHMIPLSRQAMTLLEGLPRVDPVFVFPGAVAGSRSRPSPS